MDDIHKKSIEQMRESRRILQRYAEYVEERGGDPYHHLAFVCAGKKVVGCVYQVGIVFKTDEVLVIICGEEPFCADYHSEYSTRTCTFVSHASNNIIIKDATDYCGNPVQIEIKFCNPA